jgi:hypothetical protein
MLQILYNTASAQYQYFSEYNGFLMSATNPVIVEYLSQQFHNGNVLVNMETAELSNIITININRTFDVNTPSQRIYMYVQGLYNYTGRGTARSEITMMNNTAIPTALVIKMFGTGTTNLSASYSLSYDRRIISL